jgi:hypothetical protein
MAKFQDGKGIYKSTITSIMEMSWWSVRAAVVLGYEILQGGTKIKTCRKFFILM